MSNDPERSDASQISTDRESIRTWAEEHEAVPFRDREEEAYRLADEETVGETHERADWDEFHSHLDENEQVVIYHGDTSDEPFEVAHRNEAMSRSNVDDSELEERLLEGETVTSTVTETTVVEEVIVEEATVESELIDTEVIDDRVTDVELVSRECTNCTLEETGTIDSRDWFDDDHYKRSAGYPGMSMGAPHGEVTASDAALDETKTTDTADTEVAADTDAASEPGMGMRDVESDYPYNAVLDVEETWDVTREFTERYTVESRITNVDVGETDTVAEHDIDVEGLQRNIAESGFFDVDLSPDEVIQEYDVETEFHEDDRANTHFTRSRVVEDRVRDRRRVRADVTAAEQMDFERIDAGATEMAGSGTASGSTREDVTTSDDEEVMHDSAAMETASGSEVETGSGDIPLSQDEVGKDVVDASGETIGMVTDVSEDGMTMFVDAHPGITEKIKAALDWGEADDDDYPVEVEQIDHVTRDAITLKGTEELDDLDSPAM